MRCGMRGMRDGMRGMRGSGGGGSRLVVRDCRSRDDSNRARLDTAEAAAHREPRLPRGAALHPLSRRGVGVDAARLIVRLELRGLQIGAAPLEAAAFGRSGGHMLVSQLDELGT